jgi:hypothetical protein
MKDEKALRGRPFAQQSVIAANEQTKKEEPIFAQKESSVIVWLQ